MRVVRRNSTRFYQTECCTWATIDQKRTFTSMKIWLVGSILHTSKMTLNMHTRGIPFSHFPKTFQHAILICRGLGVNYLWIDSLCIIQDSEEDWALQSARMTDVYSNSWLKIGRASCRERV